MSGAFEGRDLLRDPPPSGDALLFVAETHPSREKATATYALRTEDHKEGVRSFLERRPPEWKLRPSTDLPDWPED